MRAHVHSGSAAFPDVDFTLAFPDEAKEKPRSVRRGRDETDWLREFADEPDEPVTVADEAIESPAPVAPPIVPSRTLFRPGFRAPDMAGVALLSAILAVLWMVLALQGSAPISDADVATEFASAQPPAQAVQPTNLPVTVVTPTPPVKPAPQRVSQTQTASVQVSPPAQRAAVAPIRQSALPPAARRDSRAAVTPAPTVTPPAEVLNVGPAMSAAATALPAPSLAASIPTPTPTPAPTAPPVVAERRLEAPPPSRPVPARSVREVETAAVQGVLERYRTAFSSLSAAGVQSFWPGANTRALNRAFDLLQSQTFDFESCAVDVSMVTSSATARCSGQAAFVPKVGSRSERVERRAWSFQLSRVNERWVITSVESR